MPTKYILILVHCTELIFDPKFHIFVILDIALLHNFSNQELRE